LEKHRWTSPISIFVFVASALVNEMVSQAALKAVKDRKPRQLSFKWTGPDKLAKEKDLIAVYATVVADSQYRSEGDKIKGSGWQRIHEIFNEKWQCPKYDVLMVIF
jgi:hypothetical protein